MKKLRPLRHLLIVDDDLRLRKEARKTMRKVELFGALPSVLRSAGTPAVKKRAACMQLLDVLNYRGNGDALAASAADERVVDINVDAELAGHA